MWNVEHRSNMDRSLHIIQLQLILTTGSDLAVNINLTSEYVYYYMSTPWNVCAGRYFVRRGVVRKFGGSTQTSCGTNAFQSHLDLYVNHSQPNPAKTQIRTCIKTIRRTFRRKIISLRTSIIFVIEWDILDRVSGAWSQAIWPSIYQTAFMRYDVASITHSVPRVFKQEAIYQNSPGIRLWFLAGNGTTGRGANWDRAVRTRWCIGTWCVSVMDPLWWQLPTSFM